MTFFFGMRVRSLMRSCLVLFHLDIHGLPLAKHFDFRPLWVSEMNLWVTKARFLHALALSAQLFPSLLPSFHLSLSLSLIYTFSPPTTLVDSPSAPQRPLTDARLTDLLLQSHHWLPAWQSWFNARFWLVQERQANLWPCCDSTLAVFDVSYRSVAYGTQKRCQVSIVKLSPQGKEQGVLDIPDVMRARGGGGGEKEREGMICSCSHFHSHNPAAVSLWNAFTSNSPTPK